MCVRTTCSRIVVSCLLVLAINMAIAKDPPVASVSSDVALSRLKEGNARFVAQHVTRESRRPEACRDGPEPGAVCDRCRLRQLADCAGTGLRPEPRRPVCGPHRRQPG